MIINHEREKLIQVISYFAKNTRSCGKVKLFKLLYFLDFEHYKVTGRSVTGLTYNAWKYGPVPVSLHEELDSPEPDFASAIKVSEISVRNNAQAMLSLTPISEFSAELFTKRELKLLEKLASEYHTALADDMIEATHLENMPWDKVYNKNGEKQAVIPYEYALAINEKEEMLKIVHEREAMFEAMG